MISVNYVNGSLMDIPMYDPFNVFESELNDVLDSVHNAYNEYQEAMNEYNLSVEFFESGDDVKLEAVEEKKSNFVDRIGAAIIEVGKKAIAFINNLINKIQESLFANKTDMQKVSALCKKNPDMAEDINKAFRDGSLQVADLRSIKELESAYDEIMRLAKQQNVDPNTLKGKWIAAKKKFGNLEQADLIKGVTAGVGLVVTIAKLPDAIASFGTIKSKISKINDEAEIAAMNKEKAAIELDITRRTHEDKVSKAKSDAVKSRVDAKLAEDTAQDKRKEAASSSRLKAIELAEKRNTQKDRLAKGKADAEKSKLDAKFAKDTFGDRVSKTYSDAVDAKHKRGKGIKPIDAMRSLIGASESVDDFIYDDNGYITESVSDAMRSVVASIHSDMVRVYTTLANFNFKTLSRAKVIMAAAIKGYEKDPKTVDKKPEKEVEDEE